MNAGTGFGLYCPNCATTINVYTTIGGDPSKCPNCGTKMVPNPSAAITANAHCNKCDSFVGITNLDCCPHCGEPYSAQ